MDTLTALAAKGLRITLQELLDIDGPAHHEAKIIQSMRGGKKNPIFAGFAKRLRFLRESKNMTRAQLASRAGVTERAILNIELLLKGFPRSND